MTYNKLKLLTAYNSALNYYLICLMKTHLDSIGDQNNLFINGHNLLRAGNGKVKKGGECLYFREVLTQLADTLYIEQCNLCEISIQNTTDYVAVIYRSPSQFFNELEEFLINFKLLNQVNMLISSFTVILIDFNGRS